MDLGSTLHGPVLCDDALALFVKDALARSGRLGTLRKRFDQRGRLAFQPLLGTRRDCGRRLCDIVERARLACTFKVSCLLGGTGGLWICCPFFRLEEFTSTLSLLLI